MTTSSRQRTRAILRAAWETLREHPTLVCFPLLSAAATLAIMLVGATLSFGGDLLDGGMAADANAWLRLAAPDDGGVVARGHIAAGLVVWIGVHLTTMLTSVALANATLEAMAARAWTVAGSLHVAFGRLPAVATVAVLEATVGRMVARMRGDPSGRRKRGSLGASVLELAWWTATYLVVPVLARESRGGLAAIARSATLVRSTWKEAFLGRLALMWIYVLLAIVAAIPICVCALLHVENGIVLALAAGIPGALAVLAILGLQTLETIYRAALYVFATEGVVPARFDDPDLHEIWCVRGAE